MGPIKSIKVGLVCIRIMNVELADYIGWHGFLRLVCVRPTILVPKNTSAKCLSSWVRYGLNAVIRLFFSDDRFVALSSRSQMEIQSFGSERLLSPAPDVRCGCDVCLT